MMNFALFPLSTLMVFGSLANAAPLFGAGASTLDQQLKPDQMQLVNMLFGQRGIITSMIGETLRQMPTDQYQKLSQFVYLGEQPNQPQPEVQHQSDGYTLPPAIMEEKPKSGMPPVDKETQVLVNTIWQFLRHSKYGHPHFEQLPAFGSCNEVKCSQMYDRLEFIRRSKAFLDLQTFFSLMQDEEGVKLIADLLAEPDSEVKPAVNIKPAVEPAVVEKHPRKVSSLAELWNTDDPVFQFSDDAEVHHLPASADDAVPVISSSLDDFYSSEPSIHRRREEETIAHPDSAKPINPVPAEPKAEIPPATGKNIQRALSALTGFLTGRRDYEERPVSRVETVDKNSRRNLPDDIYYDIYA